MRRQVSSLVLTVLLFFVASGPASYALSEEAEKSNRFAMALETLAQAEKKIAMEKDSGFLEGIRKYLAVHSNIDEETESDREAGKFAEKFPVLSALITLGTLGNSISELVGEEKEPGEGAEDTENKKVWEKIGKICDLVEKSLSMTAELASLLEGFAGEKIEKILKQWEEDIRAVSSAKGKVPVPGSDDQTKLNFFSDRVSFLAAVAGTAVSAAQIRNSLVELIENEGKRECGPQDVAARLKYKSDLYEGLGKLAEGTGSLVDNLSKIVQGAPKAGKIGAVVTKLMSKTCPTFQKWLGNVKMLDKAGKVGGVALAAFNIYAASAKVDSAAAAHQATTVGFLNQPFRLYGTMFGLQNDSQLIKDLVMARAEVDSAIHNLILTYVTKSGVIVATVFTGGLIQAGASAIDFASNLLFAKSPKATEEFTKRKYQILRAFESFPEYPAQGDISHFNWEDLMREYVAVCSFMKDQEGLAKMHVIVSLHFQKLSECSSTAEVFRNARDALAAKQFRSYLEMAIVLLRFRSRQEWCYLKSVIHHLRKKAKPSYQIPEDIQTENPNDEGMGKFREAIFAKTIGTQPDAHHFDVPAWDLDSGFGLDELNSKNDGWHSLYANDLPEKARKAVNETLKKIGETRGDLARRLRELKDRFNLIAFDIKTATYSIARQTKEVKLFVEETGTLLEKEVRNVADYEVADAAAEEKKLAGARTELASLSRRLDEILGYAQRFGFDLETYRFKNTEAPDFSVVDAMMKDLGNIKTSLESKIADYEKQIKVADEGARIPDNVRQLLGEFELAIENLDRTAKTLKALNNEIPPIVSAMIRMRVNFVADLGEDRARNADLARKKKSLQETEEKRKATEEQRAAEKAREEAQKQADDAYQAAVTAYINTYRTRDNRLVLPPGVTNTEGINNWLRAKAREAANLGGKGETIYGDGDFSKFFRMEKVGNGQVRLMDQVIVPIEEVSRQLGSTALPQD